MINSKNNGLKGSTLNKINPVSQKFNSSIYPKVNKPREQTTQYKNSNKRLFTCRCGYSFSLDATHFSEVICPWCGKVLEE